MRWLNSRDSFPTRLVGQDSFLPAIKAQGEKWRDKSDQTGQATTSPPSLTLSPLALAGMCMAAAVVGGLLLAFGGPLAALALLLAGAALAIALRDLEMGFWGVAAVICLLPFATIPVDLGLTPTFLDAALGVVVVVWVLRLLTGRQRRVVTAPLTLPLLIFLIVALFAFIFGLRNGPFTPTLARKFAELLLSIGFVIVVVDYCRSWERLERLTRILLLGGGAAALLAIGVWLLPDETANAVLNLLTRVGYPGGWVIRYIEENPALAERAIGTSVDPNALGGLLVLFGALAAPQLLTERPLLPRWLTLSIGGLILAAVLLTFSRGAFLALGAGLLFLALARYRRLLLYMLLGLVLIMLLPATQTYVVRLAAGFQGSDLATQMRFGEYRDALELIGRYPVFGVGFAGAPDIDLYLGVANVYLSIAQQMGLLGLAAFFAIMLALFSHAWWQRPAFHSRSRQADIWLGLYAAVTAGLAAGIFDHYLFNTVFHHTVTAFWLMVGLAAAATRLGQADQATSPPPSRRPTL